MTSERTTALQEVVAAAAERHGVPGVAVGLWHDGRADHVCSGVTSVDNPLPVDEHTLFQIGSTTKTFTATMMMRLVERGEIELDAPVRTYLPDFRVADEDVSAKVTIRNLLTHTAGWEGDRFNDTGHGDDALTRFVAAMADFEQTTPLGGPASYNNAAFVVAGHVVATVTGLTYEDAMRQLVLDPLGLDETFAPGDDVFTRRFAVGHVERDGKPVVSRPYRMSRSAAPAGDLVSSVSDQIRYARFCLGDGTAADGTRFLSSETMQLMHRPAVERTDGGHVGIAWMIRDFGGLTVVGHGGTSIGQQSAFDLVPERDFAVTILTNAHSGDRVLDEVGEWVFERYLGVVEEKPEPLSLPPEQLEEYAGLYHRPEFDAAVTVEGDRLVLSIDYNEEGRAMVLRELGTLVPLPPPGPVAIVAPDEYFALEGPLKGMRGRFLRDESERVVTIDLGGRLAHRVTG